MSLLEEVSLNIRIKAFLQAIAPAFTLVLLSPMIAEVRPGATRFSSLFVLPIEHRTAREGTLPKP